MCLLVSRHQQAVVGSDVTKQEHSWGKETGILVSGTQKEIILKIYISMQIQWILQHFGGVLNTSGGRCGLNV